MLDKSSLPKYLNIYKEMIFRNKTRSSMLIWIILNNLYMSKVKHHPHATNLLAQCFFFFKFDLVQKTFLSILKINFLSYNMNLEVKFKIFKHIPLRSRVLAFVYNTRMILKWIANSTYKFFSLLNIQMQSLDGIFRDF